MYLPQLRGVGRKAQRQVIEFGGLNYTQNVRDGELESARGVSAGMWPCLTTRAGRTFVQSLPKGTDLFAWDKLVAVDGSSLLYDGQVVGAVTPGRKQFAVVNTKLCIFPDKKYLDLETMKVEELGVKVESTWSWIGNEPVPVKFHGDMLEIDLKVEDNYIDHAQGVTMKFKPYREEDLNWSPSERWTLPDMTEVWGGDGVWPTRVREGDCILLRQFQSNGVWYDCKCTELGVDWTEAHDGNGDYFYVTQNTSIASGSGYLVHLTGEIRRRARIPQTLSRLAEGDRVNITGCVNAQENDREALEVKEVGVHSITFVLPDGIQFTEAVETQMVTVERVVPELDFVCASGNRLFGCSSKDNTIYVSALGDPTNWFAYAGLASDSYAVAVGSPGNFTGCCAYGSSVLFWKENALHKLMGLYPEEYEVISYQFVGVQAGCERSIQNINEALIYKGRDGVYTYTGGYPQKISGKLGLTDYDSAVAGSDARGYVISMRRLDTLDWETLRYDLDTGLWMGEDNAKVAAFATLDGALYSLEDGGVYRREGETDRPEGEDGQETGIPWEAVFVPVTETVHGKKGYSRLLLRLELDPGAWADIDISEDGGLYKTVWTARAGEARALVIPVRPGRCDRFQVRLRGEGRFVLRSMVREFAVGSVIGKRDP